MELCASRSAKGSWDGAGIPVFDRDGHPFVLASAFSSAARQPLSRLWPEAHRRRRCGLDGREHATRAG
jgi:hypothetical protein